MSKNNKLIKRFTKQIGRERSAEILLKLFDEVKNGEIDDEFRNSLSNVELRLLDEYALCYVKNLLNAVSVKLLTLRPNYLEGARQ